jgi:hypothetical protein
MAEIGSGIVVEDAYRLGKNGTLFRLPDNIEWSPQPGFPPLSLENAVLDGDLAAPGTYLTLVRWHPGFMSAPHNYATDRICMVLSGTWWINSGSDFEPSKCVGVPTGTFVKRRARTPHYDGVVAGARSPAVIAIYGTAPLLPELVDPAKPGWRKV